MNPFRKSDWIRFTKRRWWQLFLVQALLLLAVGALGAWSFFPQVVTEPGTDGPAATDVDHEHGGSADSSVESEPQWWTCAMHPQIRSPKEGKCPICQMELVPVNPSAGGLRTLTIKPAVKELMKVQTAPVERKYVTAKIRMVGKVDYDETRLAHITAWVSGRLDRLYVDYTGVKVTKGDHMVYIYSEELYSIQEELISAIRFNREHPNQRSGGLDLAGAAREKLRLLGLTDDQISKIEQLEKPDDHITIYSPVGGIVIEKLKEEGDRVMTGDRIYTVADLTQVWVKLDAYESDLIWLRYGQSVSFTSESYPGETFKGRVAFIDPILNKSTRTVKVRVNVPNLDGRLKPEMFIRAVISSNIAAGGRVLDAELAGKWISPMHPEIVKDQPGVCDICGMPLVRAESLGYVTAKQDPLSKPLVIPVTAALLTGTRAIVYVEVMGAKEPTYEGREVLLGPRAGDYYIIRNGLHDGEMVVTNGNFKIDSALQLQAKPTMMTPQGGNSGGMMNMGSGTKNKTSDSKKMDSSSALPAGFSQQLRDLISLSQNATLQFDTGDIESARAAFGEFGKSLNRVNAVGLADQPAMLWKEYLMLLGNDAVEGSEATNMKVAERTLGSLTENIGRMRQKFMLTDIDPQDSEMAEMVTLKVPTEFKTQLSSLFKAYLQLQGALASDDIENTGVAISAIQSSIAGIDDQALDETAREAWQQEKKNFDVIDNRLDAAKDMTAARAEFALLSEQLLAVIQLFGISGAGDVYELHCPMAFEGRGASWLQDNDETKNPYFGASMLTCSDRVRKIEAGGPMDEGQEARTHE